MLAVRHNGRIAVAADSLWSNAWHEGRERAQPKLWRRGDTIISVGPSAGFGVALRRQLYAFMEQHEDWPERWAERCLDAKDESALGRLAKSHAETVLLVWTGRVFQVSAAGNVFEPASGMAACGCAGQFAIGAATVLARQLRSARAVAMKACAVACELSSACAPPIICETVRCSF